MEHTRRILVSAARQAFDLDTAYGQVDRLNRRVGRVRQDRRRLVEALGESGFHLG